MFSGQSAFGIGAAALYALVAMACGYASLRAASAHDAKADMRHWMLIALFFCGLIALRAFDIEDILRGNFRGWLRAEGVYQDRRDYQRPLVAGLIAIAAPLIFMLIYRFANHRAARRNLAVGIALIASFVMLGVLGLRIISLHQIDRLLYGPLKLNWLFDIGASMTVLGAAIFFIRERQRSR